MRRIIKNNLLGFILGAIIFSGVTVLATQYLAKDISFSPKNSTWKASDGSDIVNVKDAIDDLYKLKNNINLNEKLELIEINTGKDINISSGYKYIIISNSEWTSGGVDHLPNIKITNNTNSEIILEKSSSNYSGNYGGCSWLIIARILDTSKPATFSSNNAPAYNIVFGIKE